MLLRSELPLSNASNKPPTSEPGDGETGKLPVCRPRRARTDAGPTPPPRRNKIHDRRPAPRVPPGHATEDDDPSDPLELDESEQRSTDPGESD